MAQHADRVYTDAGDISRIEALCAQLEDTRTVGLTFIDGSECVGVVQVKPILQLFVDADGQEGTNALLRLDPLDGDDHVARSIWVDELLRVARQPTAPGGAAGGQ